MKLKHIFKHAWQFEDSSDVALGKSLRFKRAISVDDVIALVILKSTDMTRPAAQRAEAHHATSPTPPPAPLLASKICGQDNLINEEEIELIRRSYLAKSATLNDLDAQYEPSLAVFNELVLLGPDEAISLELSWKGDNVLYKIAGDGASQLGATNVNFTKISAIYQQAFPLFTQPNEENVNLRLTCWMSFEPKLYCYTGTRFGCENAIYPDHPDLCHSAFLHAPETFSWRELVGLERIATNNRKVSSPN